MHAAAPLEPCRSDAPAITDIGAALATGGRPAAERAALLHRRGQMLHAQGDDPAAEDDYDAALALAPDLAEAYLDRATLLADQARFEPALADLDRAIGLRPDLAEAYLRRGGVSYELGADTETRSRTSRGRSSSIPRSPAAWLGRANALRDSGHAEQALADYDAALRLAPGRR